MSCDGQWLYVMSCAIPHRWVSDTMDHFCPLTPALSAASVVYKPVQSLMLSIRHLLGSSTSGIRCSSNYNIFVQCVSFRS